MRQCNGVLCCAFFSQQLIEHQDLAQKGVVILGCEIAKDVIHRKVVQSPPLAVFAPQERSL
jgi:hypothetical protein